MTENAHTTGRWIFMGQTRNGLESIVYLGNSNVAISISGANNEADARLIAAAPELYEALCDMVSDRSCLSDATIDFARTALAKARGQS